MLDLEDTPEMHEEYRRLYGDYLRQGWKPQTEPRRFVCGWCRQSVSSQLGLFKHETDWVAGPLNPFGAPQSYSRDIRICVDCGGATTFVEKEQYPPPLLGERFDLKDKSPEVEQITALYNEACVALSQGGPSCAVLMFRKLLMHIAVEQGAEKGLNFVQYAKHLKDEGVVGKPQYDLLTRIKDAGNEENHEVRRATVKEAADLLNLVSLLIRSVYFAA